MSKRLETLGDKTRVFLADTFEGIVKASEKDNYCVGGEFSNTSVETVHELAKIIEVSNYDILKGIYPDQTGEKVKDFKIRLCHIDVDVYEGAKDILNEIWERLVPNGLVVFDDYGCKDTEGINTFVNEQKRLNDRIVIYNLNGHAIIIKI
jgi:O-methyltransferase